MERLAIETCGPVRGSVRPPGSKSLTNRALVCAALAKGVSHLSGVLESEDTVLMLKALQTLGIPVQFDSAKCTARVEGVEGKLPVKRADLFIGNSGTTVRFLSAMLAGCQGEFRLDGTPRMRERPIEPLLVALRSLGCDAISSAGTGCPPVELRCHGLPGGRVSVAGDVSSQFLSGLLLAAPLAAAPLTLEIPGELVSIPYVEMTLKVMQAFGIDVSTPENWHQLLVQAPQSYVGQNYAIEPDASAASYFFAAAAITGGEVTVQGLHRAALQGDVGFCDILKNMGCEVEYAAEAITVRGGPLRGVHVNMNAVSDTVQTLAAVALFAEGPTRIEGVAHIRHKESDRIGDLARELRKLGAQVEEFADGLEITPGVLQGAEIATYQDHRMAMSLALVGLRQPGVVIQDPGCTAKTYPRFFEDLRQIAAV